MRAADYEIYGVRLRSEIPLPPLPRRKRGDSWDVELLRATSDVFRPFRPQSTGRRSEPWFSHRLTPEGSSYLRWRGVFEFLILSDGKSIHCRSLGGSSIESFRTYLLGQVLSFALLRRGAEPLHATAVVIDGRAIALLGDCGYGKSSLGAAFVGRGFSLLTDDLLLLKKTPRGFLAYPGFPRVKLYPSVASRILSRAGRGSPLNPGTSKRVIPLGKTESWPEAAPLAGIYLLPSPEASRRTRRRSIRLLPVSKHGAFLEIVKSTFNPILVDGDRLKRQFRFADELSRVGLVKRLSYPRGLGRLSEIADRILEDLRAQA